MSLVKLNQLKTASTNCGIKNKLAAKINLVISIFLSLIIASSSLLIITLANSTLLRTTTNIGPNTFKKSNTFCNNQATELGSFTFPNIELSPEHPCS